MAAHGVDLRQAMDWLVKHGFANGKLSDNEAELYVTSAAGGTPQRYDRLRRFKPDQVTFYGTIQPQQMLQQFAQLRDQRAYDGVLLITDQGSYALSDEQQTVPEVRAPLWMVHLGGNLPPAYDDATLQAIQASEGGVATTLPEGAAANRARG